MNTFTKTLLILLLPLMGVSHAAIIEIQGFADRSTSGGDFVDIGDGSGGTTTDSAFGDSIVTSGDYTLTLFGNTPVDTSAPEDDPKWVGVRTSSGDSSGNEYTTGSELNLKGFIDSNSFTEAVDNESFLEIELKSSGSNFSLNSISVSLWRNGSAAQSDYQFGETDGTALGSSQSFGETEVGNADTITVSGLSSTFNNESEATVRLYAWGESTNGNTHFYNVEADYSVIPEPGTLALIGLFMVKVVAMIRRRR